MNAGKKSENGTSPKRIREDDLVGKAISQFDRSTDILIVSDKNDNYSGVLPEWAILRSNMDINSAKVKNFKFFAPKISKDTSIPESARLMVENNLMYLPVFDGDRVTGVVGYKQILESKVFKDMGNDPIKGIVPKLCALTAGDSLSMVFNRFKEDQKFSMPVVENGALLGTVSLHDVINTLPRHRMRQEREGYSRGRKVRAMDMSVKSLMSRPRTTVHEDARVSEVISKLLESNMDSIQVVDGNKKLRGVITVKDLLKLAAEAEPVAPRPTVQINSNVPDLNRAEVEAAVFDFLDRYGDRLANGRVEVYMRGCARSQKDQNLIQTRVRLFSHKEKFSASAEEHGDIHSVKLALGKLESQIERTKHENRQRPGNRHNKIEDKKIQRARN
jgi:CBS domain-containing protein